MDLNLGVTCTGLKTPIKRPPQTTCAADGFCIAWILSIQILIGCKNEKNGQQLGKKKTNMDSVAHGGNLQFLCLLQTHLSIRPSKCYATRRAVSSGSKTKVMWEIWGPLLALQQSWTTLKRNSRGGEQGLSGLWHPQSLLSPYTVGAVVLSQFK